MGGKVDAARSRAAATGAIEVDRVAETHFMLRPVLESALRSQILTAEGQQALGTAATTYAEVWSASFGDRFFDMGTFIRLGTAVENGLRHFHREISGTRVVGGVFQRLVDPAEIVKLLREDCDYILTDNGFFDDVREVMVHRHLFAHRSGLVDAKYVKDLMTVTGEDIEEQLVSRGYPDDDVYWFEPIKRLRPSSKDVGLIEAARRFFRELGAPTE